MMIHDDDKTWCEMRDERDALVKELDILDKELAELKEEKFRMLSAMNDMKTAYQATAKAAATHLKDLIDTKARLAEAVQLLRNWVDPCDLPPPVSDFLAEQDTSHD